MSDSIKELFVSIYGGPIYFTMKACTEKKELQQLISCWGGEMTETTGPHTIHLVSKGEEAPKTGDSFHVQYIYDCIDKERLLLIDKYRVNKNSCYVGNMTAMWVMLGKSSWPDCQLKRWVL
ncbi:uncharacterized protein LOC121875044 [Homarus americanus]|uniref:uncharacterized protein LOC121875044 n=1 Tax=Homarus americanus TaxID=6706 RepID=UPI001C464A8F|nr:uncharacterized protein LOC121875044 [Homarus americanus]